jgi:hypothetical protein
MDSPTEKPNTVAGAMAMMLRSPLITELSFSRQIMIKGEKERFWKMQDAWRKEFDEYVEGIPKDE